MQLMNAEDAMTLLYLKGWSSGDIAYDLDGTRTWLVFCHRGGDQIRTTAPARREAWEKAARSAQCRDN